jgi:hypothetical protein
MHVQRTLSRRGFLGLLGTSAAGLCALSRVNAGPLHDLNNLAGRGSGPQEADKVHLIVTGYTRPDNVGKACAQDCQAMVDTLDAAGLGSQLRIHDLTGNAYSAGAVMHYLNQAPELQEVGPRQVVCFYHSGHGNGLGVGCGEAQHELDLNAGKVNRQAVRLALQRRNPYGIIILSDCCSGQARPTQSPLPGTRAIATPNAATIRNLFLRRPQLINITAAQPGTLASSAHGAQFNGHGAESAFTVALMQFLYTPRVYNSWNELFPAWQDLCAMVSRPQSHRPYAFGPLLERAGAGAIGAGPEALLVR